MMNNKNQKIKILFRHRSMEMGGVEKVILSLFENLDKEKFEITLCLNLYQGELRNSVPNHIKYIKLTKGKEDFSQNKIIYKLQLFIRRIQLFLYEKNFFIVDKFILKEKYDIEIAPTFSAYQSVLNSTNKKSKKVAWLHSDITIDGFSTLRKKLLNNLEQFDFVFWGSNQIKNALEKNNLLYKFPNNQVVLNIVDVDEIKQKSLEFNANIDSENTFVSVARLHYRKGQRTMLEAHNQLIKEGFLHKIILIGDGEDFHYLKNKVKEYNLENTFILLGAKTNPYPYIIKADYFILCSENEGWPLIIAETMLLKKPILSTNVGGIPEMIEHQKDGFLIGSSKFNIYNGIKEFISNKKLIENIKKNLENIEGKFDNKKIINSVENVFLNFLIKNNK